MNEIEWHPEKMLEIKLKEPDDFLKVRETLSLLAKRKNYINLVISYTNKVDTLSSILKSYLLLMEKEPILTKTIYLVETQLLHCWAIGD
jgi:flagellar biosynthesis GTPase FlhF